MAERSLVKNAADERQVKRAGQKERDRRTMELDDLRWVLSERPGRRHIWRRLDGLHTSSFNTNGSIVFFNEGRRDVQLRLLADVMEASPELYLTMQREAIDDQQRESREQSAKELDDSQRKKEED